MTIGSREREEEPLCSVLCVTQRFKALWSVCVSICVKDEVSGAKGGCSLKTVE